MTAQTAFTSPAIFTSLHSPHHLKLLVVDRDAGVADTISRGVAGGKMQVMATATGMQGYWLAINEQPDAVVTDLGMHNGSGGEMLECLQADAATKDIPVIVLTGRNYPGMHDHLKRVGAFAVLEKPLEVGQLLEVVSDLLKQIEA